MSLKKSRKIWTPPQRAPPPPSLVEVMDLAAQWIWPKRKPLPKNEVS